MWECDGAVAVIDALGVGGIITSNPAFQYIENWDSLRRYVGLFKKA